MEIDGFLINSLLVVKTTTFQYYVIQTKKMLVENITKIIQLETEYVLLNLSYFRVIQYFTRINALCNFPRWNFKAFSVFVLPGKFNFIIVHRNMFYSYFKSNALNIF